MSLHRLQHSKYAKNMQKICKKYAQYATKICNKYAINMQNMHKSMYLHILHIYALPTLLMLNLGYSEWLPVALYYYVPLLNVNATLDNVMNGIETQDDLLNFLPAAPGPGAGPGLWHCASGSKRSLSSCQGISNC